MAIRSAVWGFLAIVARPVLRPAAGSGDLDWKAWRRLPVFARRPHQAGRHAGSQIVQAVCGRENPKLSLTGAAGSPSSGSEDSKSPDPAAGAPELGRRPVLFPDGQPRSFSAAELLFAWIAEPARWERVPLLAASNERLRRELLDLPTTDRKGIALTFASPWQVAKAEKFLARWSAIREEQQRARQGEKPFELTGLDKAVSELAVAYNAYRFVSFSSRGAQRRAFAIPGAAGRVDVCMAGAERRLELLPRAEGPGSADPVAATSKTIDELRELGIKGEEAPWISLSQAESLAVKLRESTAGLASQVETFAKGLAASPAGIDAAQLDRVRVRVRAMSAATTKLARLARDLHWALYDSGFTLSVFDSGHTMNVVPALDAAALERDREAGDDAQPWLSIQSLLFGSPQLMRDYPSPS